MIRITLSLSFSIPKKYYSIIRSKDPQYMTQCTFYLSTVCLNLKIKIESSTVFPELSSWKVLTKEKTYVRTQTQFYELSIA